MIEHLMLKLEQEIKHHENIVLGSTVRDFTEYRNIMGIIHGLKVALELVKQADQDDEFEEE